MSAASDRRPRRNHQDRAVHLSRAGNHILDDSPRDRDNRYARNGELVGLIFHVSHGDRDRLGLVANGASLGDVRVGLRLARVRTSSDCRGHDGGRQRRLAVVDVADRPHVDVRLFAIKFLLGHGFLPTHRDLEVNCVVQHGTTPK